MIGALRPNALDRASRIAAAALAATILVAAAAPAAAQQRASSASEQAAETMLVATRAIPAGVVLRAGDVVALDRRAPPGMLVSPEQAIGRETRISLYPDRPISPGALGAPTLIRRNSVVSMAFELGALTLRSEGRALDDGGRGDRIRVMNLDSRRTVYGTVVGPAQVVVQ
ncbi:MAG: flagellar basal body P-ring formation chaperone FlgA [Pseudomonadota bacterium]